MTSRKLTFAEWDRMMQDAETTRRIALKHRALFAEQLRLVWAWGNYD